MNRPTHGTSARPLAVTNLVARALALATLGFVLWDASRFPVFPELLMVGLTAYALLLVVEVRVWLLAVPAAVAVLSLGYWSGRYFWDAFDLFVLVTLAGGLWSTTPWWPRGPAWKVLAPVAVFATAQLAFTLNGLYPLEIAVDGSWADYFASTNALREGKGVLWALLLTPMLLQAQRADGLAARWVVAGMSLGLLAAVTAIIWERHLYTGILNFGHAYRVSGSFFDLHTGGAAIDVALAMMWPFVFGLWVWWRRWPAHIAMLSMLLLGAYGLFVTFSRANYPAVGLGLLVVLIGLLTLPRSTGRRHRMRMLKYAAAGVSVLVLVPVIMGGTIAERFKTTSRDLQTRLEHWQTAISLVNDGTERLVGAGKGAFPRRYHLASAFEGETLATLFRRQEGQTAFMHFSASDERGSLDLRQRFRPGGQRVLLKLTARTAPGTRERLLIEFCERHVLRVRSECAWVGTDIADTRGQWQEYSRSIPVKNLGRGDRWWDRSPVDISILNRGIKRGLDIASVRLVDTDGNDLLANPDFSQGMDHWFMVDGNHLRWHAKNIFVYTYVEGGLLGLGVFLATMLFALSRAWAVHRRGDPMGVILAASIVAGLAIGLFDSILDAPRVTVLFVLLVFAALVWTPQPVPLAGRLPAYPSWLPRPAIVTAGLAAALILVVGASQFRSSGMSFSQAVVHVGGKLGMSRQWLFGVVNEPPAQIDARFDLRPVRRAPRIWRLTPRNVGEGTCVDRGMASRAICWAATGDVDAGRDALAALSAMWDVRPRSYGEYGNGWLLATVYDLLSAHPDMTPAVRAQLQDRLRRVLGNHLLLLNSDDPAVWHGRATLAAQAMMLSAVLDQGDAHGESLVRQAHYHYLQLLSALSVAEAWPEGYNYWANSRGFLIALAGYAYLQAFPEALAVADTRQVFERVGLWHLYNTRPDIKAIQIADEGPRIDLREETQRIIDVLAMITDDPRMHAYSALLEKRFGKMGYYRGFRWLRPLLGHGVDDGDVAAPMPWPLRLSAWFGPDAMNLFYLRSGWDDDATVMSFRAGHTLSHHGHYDAGHFTLFKGAPLAVTGATYQGLDDGHRVNYGVRTVSKNSLLVMRPGEQVQPEGYDRENVADGGQRVVMPIRNPLSTLADWRNNIGNGLHLEGGTVRVYRDEPGSFTYIDADITAAYNTPGHDEGGDGGKVTLVARRLLYLRRLDRVLILDRVRVTDPAYRARWLLQSQVKPTIEDGSVLKGVADDGIIATAQAEFRFSNKRGRLHVLSLLPRDRETLVVGGPHFRFYADVDGDAETLDGRNMGHNSRITSWFEPALWRLEIGARRRASEQRFLTLLSPAVESHKPPEARLLSAEDEGIVALVVDDELLLFVVDPDRQEIALPAQQGAALLRVFGLPPNAPVTVDGSHYTATADGTLMADASGRAMTIRWHRAGKLGNRQRTR